MNSGLLIYNENGINIKLDKSNIPNNNNSWIIKNITISYCNTDLCDIEIDFSIQDDKIIIKSSKFSEKIKDYNEVLKKIISQNKTDFHYLYNIYENLYFDEYIDIFKNYDNVDKFLKNYNRKTINNKLLQKNLIYSPGTLQGNGFDESFKKYIKILKNCTNNKGNAAGNTSGNAAGNAASNAAGNTSGNAASNAASNDNECVGNFIYKKKNDNINNYEKFMYINNNLEYIIKIKPSYINQYINKKNNQKDFTYYFILNTLKNYDYMYKFLKQYIFYTLLKKQILYNIYLPYSSLSTKKTNKNTYFNYIKNIYNTYLENYFNQSSNGYNINLIIIDSSDKLKEKYICIINKDITKTFILGNFELEYYQNINTKQKNNNIKITKGDLKSFGGTINTKLINVNSNFNKNFINSLDTIFEDHNKYSLIKKTNKELADFIKNTSDSILTELYDDNYIIFCLTYDIDLQLTGSSNKKFCTLENYKKIFKNIFNTYLEDNELNFNFEVDDSNNKKLVFNLMNNNKKIGNFDLIIKDDGNTITNITKTEFVPNENLNNINLNELLQKNGPMKIFPSNYIIPRNKIVKESDNLLILSYNEASASYNKDDLFLLGQYIERINPSIIVIGTQESGIRFTNKFKKAQHFQHVLKENLLTNDKYLMVDKINGGDKTWTIINPFEKLTTKINKNIRFRVYMNTDKCVKSINDNTKIKIKGFNGKKSKRSDLGTFKNLSTFKGSICYKLIIEKNNKKKKFIFVNSHFYYQEGGTKSNNEPTGLKQREDNFKKLVEEFELAKYYKKGYNIFFYGDLNFRLSFLQGITNIYTKKKLSKNTNHNKIIEGYMIEIIKNHLLDINEGKKENLHKNDEIYKFVTKQINNTTDDEKKLYNSFKKSIENSRTLLSAKHFNHNDSKDLTELYNKHKNDIENLSNANGDELFKYFKIDKKKPNKSFFDIFKECRELDNGMIVKPPSNPDRILYSIHNDDVSVKKNNLKMLLQPSKSDHKLIALKVDLNF